MSSHQPLELLVIDDNVRRLAGLAPLHVRAALQAKDGRSLRRRLDTSTRPRRMPKGEWILTLPARRQRCQDCAHAAVPNPQTTERLCTSFAAYSVCRQVLAKLTCAVARKAKAASRRRCDSCMANRSGSTSTRAREPAPHAGPCTTSPRTPILILNGAAPMADVPAGPAPPLWSGTDYCTDDDEAPFECELLHLHRGAPPRPLSSEVGAASA